MSDTLLLASPLPVTAAEEVEEVEEELWIEDVVLLLAGEEEGSGFLPAGCACLLSKVNATYGPAVTNKTKTIH